MFVMIRHKKKTTVGLSLYRIQRLVFITEIQHVYFEVRNASRILFVLDDASLSF